MSVIGSIICETAPVQSPMMNIIGNPNSDRPEIEVVLQDIDVTNRNGRYYSRAEMIPQLNDSRLVELISTGNLNGEAGHPMSQDIERQSIIDPNNMAVNYKKIWVDGKDIIAKAKAADTNVGDNFNRYVLGGALPSFSLRALGSVVNTRNGAEVKNIRIITWDWVIFPSHKAAYMKSFCESGILNESGMITSASNNLLITESSKGFVVPISKKDALKIVQDNSVNFNSIAEAFDLMHESVSLKNGNITATTKTGDKLNIRLENYVSQSIMDFASKNSDYRR